LSKSRNTAATFFGIGAASMNDLSWSGSQRTYSTFKAMQADLRTIRNGTAAPDYNLYQLLRPGMRFSLEREFFGGRIRALVGASLRHVTINTYDGKRVEADNPTTGQRSVSATEGPTLLTEQCTTGRISGCNGGWDNVLRLALTLDTRDFEPDPNVGVYMGLSGQISSTAIGSSSAYGRFLAEVRGFFSPFRELTDLVLAGRVTYQVQSSNTPFHSMPTLALTDGDVEGVGGLLSLRGYQQNRFVGAVMAFANAEVRWMPVKFSTAGQHFGIGIVPFVDSGRVYDQVELKLNRWRFGHGAGLRIAWNQATIVTADLGVSSEDRSFGMNFGHSF
jgi:outer membrane protein assembly factor BamA